MNYTSCINSYYLLQYLVEDGFVVAWNDDVMVAYRVSEEILCCLFVAELNHLLCAAQVGLALALHKHAFLSEMALEVAAHLEDCDWAWLHEPADANANSRLEVCVEFETIDHVKWNSAVGK